MDLKAMFGSDHDHDTNENDEDGDLVATAVELATKGHFHQSMLYFLRHLSVNPSDQAALEMLAQVQIELN